MITREDLETAKTCSTHDFIETLKCQDLLESFMPIVMKADPAKLSVVLAILTGSMMADADLQGCIEDQNGLVDLEQRLELFNIIVRAAHKESYTFASALKLGGTQQ